MIIILEGCDGSGKSTLAKKLAAKYGMEIIKKDAPKSQEEKDNMKAMYMQEAETLDNVIYDRHMYSDMVYAPIVRGDAPSISYEDMADIEYLLRKKNAIIIHCTDTAEALWDRATARGEEYVTSFSQFVDIRRRYFNVFQNSTLPVFEHYIGISLFSE